MGKRKRVDLPRAGRWGMGSWCVWHKNGHKPSFFHATQEEAEAEAQRLADKTPGKKYIVLHVVSKFCAEAPVEQEKVNAEEVQP